MATGQLFNIQRFTLHDGGGLRTTVFLKGCPLRCAWCHNPESQSAHPERVWRAERCIACGQCVRACAHGALALTTHGPVRDSGRCVLAGACAAACPSGATEMIGRSWDAAEVLRAVLRDVAFYDESGGGVTFSGGEPLQQADFLLTLLRQARQQGLHTTLDTCGVADAAVIDAVLPFCDAVLYDVKLMDARAHERWTGRDNTQVLANLQRVSVLAAAQGASLTVRVPLVAGVNDDGAEATSLSALLLALTPVPPVDLLPYQPLGGSKYERLQRAAPSFATPSPAAIDAYASVLRRAGINVTVRGEPHEFV